MRQFESKGLLKGHVSHLRHMKFSSRGQHSADRPAKKDRPDASQDKSRTQPFAMRLKRCWSKTPAPTMETEPRKEHGANSRPDSCFGEEGLPEGEVTYTGSSLNDGFYPSDALTSDISLERRTSDSIDGDQFRQLQQECENLRKEKLELSRALYDIERQSEVLTKQCSQILEANNEKLRTALDNISELNGIVKYLKKESVKQSNTIAELKMEKTVLNNRLEAALSELYRKTGNTTFTMKEKLMITPRHPYGSITLTSSSHD